MKKIIGIIFLVLLIVLAVALRIYFLRLPGFTFDLDQFMRWGNAIKDSGFWSVYSAQNVKIVDNYPPLIPIITAWWISFSQHILPSVDLKLSFKILQTIFELVLTAVTAIFVYRSNVKYKGALLAVVIISPAVGFVSSAWGQADVVFTLLLLLGFLISQKSLTIATVLMYLSILAKPQAIPGVLVYFLFLIFAKGMKRFFYQLLVFAGLFVLTEIIFRFFGHISFVSLLAGASGFYQNSSLNAFNFWWLLHGASSWNVLDTAMAGGLSYKSLGLVLFAIFETPAIIYLFSKVKKIPEVLLVLAYTYLVFFIFPTEIHERYLYPAVAFFAFAAILNKNIFWIYLILTVTFLLNVFAVLQSVYHQFPFLQYNLLPGDWTQVVAAVNVVICVYLGIYLFYETLKTS